MAGMALAPSFFLAAVAYTIRVMVNSISMPIRQSFIMGVAAEQSRSKVAGHRQSAGAGYRDGRTDYCLPLDAQHIGGGPHMVGNRRPGGQCRFIQPFFQKYQPARIKIKGHCAGKGTTGFRRRRVFSRSRSEPECQSGSRFGSIIPPSLSGLFSRIL